MTIILKRFLSEVMEKEEILWMHLGPKQNKRIAKIIIFSFRNDRTTGISTYTNLTCPNSNQCDGVGQLIY